ncbi:MAG: M12 family metallopeptidase [Granulosicoccaceae bacterium]
MRSSLAKSFALSWGVISLLNPQLGSAEGDNTLEGEPLLTALDVDGSGSQLVTVLDTGSGVGVFEGDVLVPLAAAASSRSTSVQAQSFSVELSGTLWPDGIMPYSFGADLSSSARTKIEQAIAHWNSMTPIRLVQRTTETDYVNFIDQSGCASYIGRIGGEQPIYSSAGCSTGNFIHEIGHALGLYHEHTRPDRDDYITVNWSKISSSKSHNFDIVTSNFQVNTPYDYSSIMHYGRTFFSIDGQETITPKQSNVTIGQRNALSDHDLSGVKTLYKLGFNATIDIAARKPMPDSEIAATVQLINNTGSRLQSTSAEITLPASVLFQQVSGINWSCSQSSTQLSCSGPALDNGQETSFNLLTQSPSSVVDLDFDFNFSALNSSGLEFETDSSDTLHMTAVNDPPEITGNQELDATNASLNLSSPIGQVQARDLNGHALSSFTIEADSEGFSTLFRIDENSGDVYATGSESIDLLESQSVSLGVSVHDGFEYSDVTEVEITLSPATGALSGIGSGGGAFTAFWLLVLLPLRRLRRAGVIAAA